MLQLVLCESVCRRLARSSRGTRMCVHVHAALFRKDTPSGPMGPSSTSVSCLTTQAQPLPYHSSSDLQPLINGIGQSCLMRHLLERQLLLPILTEEKALVSSSMPDLP